MGAPARRGGVCNGGGQADLEAGAAGRTVAGEDRPAVALDDPGGDGQPQPGATLGRTRPTPEPVEDPRNVVRSKTLALLVHLESGRASGSPADDADRPATW